VNEPPRYVPVSTVNGPQRLSEAFENIRISCLYLELNSDSLVLHPVSRSLYQVSTPSDLKATDFNGNARAALVLMSFSHDFPSFVYCLARARDLHWLLNVGLSCADDIQTWIHTKTCHKQDCQYYARKDIPTWLKFTRPPIQRLPRSPLPWVKLLKREAGDLLSSVAVVKHEWRFTLNCTSNVQSDS